MKARFEVARQIAGIVSKCRCDRSQGQILFIILMNVHENAGGKMGVLIHRRRLQPHVIHNRSENHVDVANRCDLIAFIRPHVYPHTFP